MVIAFLFNAKRGDGFLVHGPHGSGKTTLIQETLGRLKWPTLEMAWSNTSDICDLVGRDRIAFGESKFEYGPLATAMKEGYALIINEVDRGHGGNLVGLNNVLEAIKPGVATRKLASTWNWTLAKYGLEKPSRLGHSIGIGYPPDWGERTMSLRPGDKTVLQPGMTFHFMTGLWSDEMGLEITETIAITDGAPELLSNVPRKLFVKD